MSPLQTEVVIEVACIQSDGYIAGFGFVSANVQNDTDILSGNSDAILRVLHHGNRPWLGE